jgi:2-keto-4-pentenoate hydratase
MTPDPNNRPAAMARWMWDARRRRLPYRNLPGELRPASIAEAYAAQEAYYRLAEASYGAVGGAKIGTTTKVMQQLRASIVLAAERSSPAPSMRRRRCCAARISST